MGHAARRRARLPSPPWRVPPRCWRQHAVYFYPSARWGSPLSDSCLELVPFLPPPRSSLSHHLSGRNTGASPAPRGVAGSLTFSSCFFSLRLGEADGKFRLRWGSSARLLVCRVVGEEGASLSRAGRVSRCCGSRWLPGESDSTREPCANPVCKSTRSVSSVPFETLT